MKSIWNIGLVVLSMLVLGHGLQAQSKKTYWTTGGEWILSFADIKQNGANLSSIARFSPVFNFQNLANFDRTEKFGLFAGFAIRNVGFIYDVPNSNIRMKYRTYNLGIPVGIKLGNLNRTFFYGGYELEIPFNLKTKTFTNEDKTSKNSVWFSGQTNTFMSAVFVGVQLPYGANLKFKYYLTNFFNKNYTAQDASGNPYKPYQNMQVNVFYFSLNFFLFKNTEFYYASKH
jgi:hypothetical protein